MKRKRQTQNVDASSAGSVERHGRGWRARYQNIRGLENGNVRSSKDEAMLDLGYLRAGIPIPVADTTHRQRHIERHGNGWRAYSWIDNKLVRGKTQRTRKEAIADALRLRKGQLPAATGEPDPDDGETLQRSHDSNCDGDVPGDSLERYRRFRYEHIYFAL